MSKPVLLVNVGISGGHTDVPLGGRPMNPVARREGGGHAPHCYID